ncbi:MAG: putative toxin-antitoxin system toxin component, PIN family [Armatimonadetes bacterium]|nr:putative toxin-antitoxin system toxin component, PIN family [Armatimonadota bacterium]
MSTSSFKNRISLILDTNVFVAANWAPSSASARLIRACKEGLAQAHYSSEVRREIERVLSTIKVRESFRRSLEDFWRQASEVLSKPVDVQTEDPEDQKFLEAALGGETDFLVTNDDHLLRIGYVGRTEIVTPKSALKLLGL